MKIKKVFLSVLSLVILFVLCPVNAYALVAPRRYVVPIYAKFANLIEFIPVVLLVIYLLFTGIYCTKSKKSIKTKLIKLAIWFAVIALVSILSYYFSNIILEEGTTYTSAPYKNNSDEILDVLFDISHVISVLIVPIYFLIASLYYIFSKKDRKTKIINVIIWLLITLLIAIIIISWTNNSFVYKGLNSFLDYALLFLQLLSIILYFIISLIYCLKSKISKKRKIINLIIWLVIVLLINYVIFLFRDYLYGFIYP